MGVVVPSHFAQYKKTTVLHNRRLLVLLNKINLHLFLLRGQQNVETQFRFV
jgi:hypothetical protein